MDNRIFILNEAPDFEPYVRLLSRERLEKIGRLPDESAKRRSAAAELLLLYALKECGVNEEIPLKTWRGRTGKPYLLSRACHYSLSHSEGACVCLLSRRGEVGIDIQAAGSQNLAGIAGRVFSGVEMSAFTAAEDKEAFFYERWTAKESYVKYLGEGVAMMKDVCAGFSEGRQYLAAEGRAGAYVFSAGYEGFYIAVSSGAATDFCLCGVSAADIAAALL